MRPTDSCWEESRIEGTAIRWVDREASGGGGELPGDLARFLRHAKECVRCGEMFDLFVDVERRVRSETAANEGAVIVLHEVREGPPIRLSDRERMEVPFALAADAPEDGASSRPQGAGEAPRSYASTDGRCRVRVIPNRTGKGATAVLLQSPEGAGTPVIVSPEREIEFGDGIHAALPGPPGSRLEIRFR